MSAASSLATLFTNRLAAINGEAPFLTGIGLNVMRGKRDGIPESAVPFCILFEGEDKPRDQLQRDYAVTIEQHYGVEGTTAVEDAQNPNDTAHKIIADIKRAIFLKTDTAPKEFKNLTYRGRSIGVRVDGSNLVTAIVLFSMEYAETLSDP